MTILTPGALLGALMLIERRVPDRHVTVDEAMAVSWLPDVDRFSETVVLRAASRWGGDRFPSIAEFVRECVGAQQIIYAEEQAEWAQGELPVGAPCEFACDDGWIATPESRTLRPCPRCEPVGCTIWLHATGPDHAEPCGDCAAIRNPRRDPPSWLAEFQALHPAQQIVEAIKACDAALDRHNRRRAAEGKPPIPRSNAQEVVDA